ncbi:hypothetical protein KL930_000530 [Ogataea haglerorum]|nr:uncharacterized protein KL911_000601 [Ogataea haglerorum]KAG7706077.1 hypothetical protein KL950_003653 [Ogataea haglerorum]KAG7725684.1 hypothetical protein KL948_004868 [Ogataea haglerorum]KAG7741466.1 hypothetical protein KL932_002753 [Ogataea haglerorum]KAG7741554.1 hypothetical protein KL923_000809 [Ogataea haglerorum]KAG7757625.1 hypothetical protein KL911_000601 [Ogataea haglerorum]
MEALDILTNSTHESSSPPRGHSISNETPRFGFDMAPAQACQPPIPHDIDLEPNYELGLPDLPDLQPKQSLESMGATLDLADFTPPQQHSPLSVSPEIKQPSDQPDPDPQPQPLQHVSRTPANAAADSNAQPSSGSTRTFCQTTARPSSVSTSTMYTRRPA